MNKQPPLSSLPDALYYPRFSINSLVVGKMRLGDGKGRRMLRRLGRGRAGASESEGRHLVSGGTRRIVPRGNFFATPTHCFLPPKAQRGARWLPSDPTAPSLPLGQAHAHL